MSASPFTPISSHPSTAISTIPILVSSEDASSTGTDSSPNGTNSNLGPSGTHSPSSNRSPSPATKIIAEPSFPLGPPKPLSPMAVRARRRKIKTRIFEIPAETKRKITAYNPVQGRGVRLGSVPNIAFALSKIENQDPIVELLHRVLFNSKGKLTSRKNKIRSFNGFIFRTEKERDRVRSKLLRAQTANVKKVAYVLDVDEKESKEDTANQILLFLEEPKVLQGRENRREKERLQKVLKKAKQRRKNMKIKETLWKKRRSGIDNESDSDGDEDLEFAAFSWIEFAHVQLKRRIQSNNKRK